jgi:hypothetical protein
VCSVPVIAQLLIGPLSEAQGIAKAVIGLVGKVLDAYLTAKANNNKCQLLGTRLQNIGTPVSYLVENLQAKGKAFMSSAPSSADETLRFKREISGIRGPLQLLKVTCQDSQSTVDEWTAKQGKGFFKACKQMLQAKNYAQKFLDLEAQVGSYLQDLQFALQAMTFLSVDRVVAALPSEATKKKWAAEMSSADVKDKQEMPQRNEVAMNSDPEFKKEMLSHFDELKGAMQEQFKDLFQFMSAQHEETLKHVTRDGDSTRSLIGEKSMFTDQKIDQLKDTVMKLSSQFVTGGGRGVIVENVDVRASDSFPGNKNFDVTAGGTHVTFCFVGAENCKFLSQMASEIKVGLTLKLPSLDAFVKDLLIDLKIRDVPVIHWNAANGWHFDFGSIKAEDLARLEASGKRMSILFLRYQNQGVSARHILLFMDCIVSNFPFLAEKKHSIERKKQHDPFVCFMHRKSAKMDLSANFNMVELKLVDSSCEVNI